MKDLSRGGRLWLGVYAVLGVLDLTAEALDLDMLTSAMLLLLMVALAVFHVQVNPHRRTRLYWFVAGALVLSWLGDNAGGIALLAKILFFLCVQALYIAAFWPRREDSIIGRRPLLTVPYLLFAVALVVLVGVAGVVGTAAWCWWLRMPAPCWSRWSSTPRRWSRWRCWPPD